MEGFIEIIGPGLLFILLIGVFIGAIIGSSIKIFESGEKEKKEKDR